MRLYGMHDAILDRLVHHSLRVELFGESIRKRKKIKMKVYCCSKVSAIPTLFIRESYLRLSHKTDWKNTH